MNDLKPGSGHAVSFRLGTSWVVAGDSTAMVNFLAASGAVSVMAHLIPPR
jgi:hypothetical protein